MKQIIVALFDTAAGVFTAPQCCPAAGVAIRQFEDLVNGPDSIYTRHPEHFELYQVGIFNDADASFDCSAPPFILSNGASLRRSFAKPV